MYARYKREPEGFRALVELLEQTPPSRRQKLIDTGMAEDAEYTKKALDCMMNFADVMALPEMEMAEVVCSTPGRIVGAAIFPLAEEKRQQFLRCAKPAVGAEIQEVITGPEPTGRDIVAAQYKMVSVAREMEKKGFVKAKQIPMYMPPPPEAPRTMAKKTDQKGRRT